MRCLLVGNDQDEALAIATGLREIGYKVAWIADLDAVSGAVRAQLPDVVVIDRIDVDAGCAEAVRLWRKAGLDAPVVIALDAATMEQRIACLDAGIDAVLVRPLNLLELEARVRALIRARERVTLPRSDVVRVGSLEFDFRKREARCQGNRLILPPRQFQLLAALAESAGEVVSRADLLKRVWNLGFDPGTKLIETHISRLREALVRGGCSDLIQTVRGGGYQLAIHTERATPSEKEPVASS